MRVHTKLIAAVLTVTLSAASAHAVPLTWTLNDVALDDGQTISGQFVFDADTFAHSEIMISNSGSGTWPAMVFSEEVFGSPAQLAVRAGPAALGVTVLSLSWTLSGQLTTNAGGTIDLNPAHFSFGSCTSADCSSWSLTLPRLVSGTISAVPEPTTATLLGIGLIALFGVRRLIGHQDG